MKENKWSNNQIDEKDKKANYNILKGNNNKDIKFKSNNLPKKNLFKNKKFINNFKLFKLKTFQNNNFFLNIFKLTLIILFYSPLLALKEVILRKLIYISEITLTIKGSGDQIILDKNNGFNNTPSEILVNGVKQRKLGFKVYGLINSINIITLRWDYEFKSCNYMFFNLTNITQIDLSKFNLTKITKMVKMFEACISLTSINFNSFDTSSVADMRNLFANCISLKSLDLSHFSTESASRMENLFYNCSSITSLDLSKFVTSKVTSMNNMFSYCTSLTTLDLSNFDTSKVNDMSYMFKDCKSLKFLNLDNFNTSSVTNMNRMFSSCRVLISLNLKSFETSLVNDMGNMFFNLKILTTLDLSNFDTRNEESVSMHYMFTSCNSLTTIYVSDKFVVKQFVQNMFNEDVNLVGGAGTTYLDFFHQEYSDANTSEYARIDGVGGPGYFTAKAASSGAKGSPTISSEPVIKTITFDANGGTGSMDSQEFDINSDSVINTNAFTNTNTQEFIGWNTASDGLGIGYADGDTIMANTFSDNITLYAQWQQHGWTLVNRDSIDISNLDAQELAYYDHGVRIESGFHVLPDLSGDDKLYYFSNGIAQSGWIKDTDDNWFYFSKLDNNDDGYVDLDAYVNGDYVIDGVTYRFDENGICLNHDGSSLAASVAGLTNNKFEIPIEAYSLRRYFMGIVY